MPTVAVILSGCGFLDGSEIHEAVSCLVHLARRGISYTCFAPDIAQVDVINHATSKPVPETRRVMVEAARISRGQITPLAELHTERFDGLVMPGGFGAAKNLSTFAAQGADCAVHPEVSRVLQEFRAAAKPMALCCIAPAIAAKVFGKNSGGPGCTLTIGNDAGTAAALEKMGATHVSTTVTQAHVDAANRLVTTPAYMYHATPWEVFQGVGAMIDQLAEMVGKKS